MTAIAGYIEIAYQRNTSAAIRDLKQQLGELPTNRSTGKTQKFVVRTRVRGFGITRVRGFGISHDSPVTITNPIQHIKSLVPILGARYHRRYAYLVLQDFILPREVWKFKNLKR